ncbi:MAG: hypothetical protein D6800_07920, partial [Candidatus Zixiibacteriota bacterium]
GDGPLSVFAADLNVDGDKDLAVANVSSNNVSILFNNRVRICCLGTTGNINCDPDDITDVSDLTTLINHLFVSFTPLCCQEEANIDGDPVGTVDIADLTALIDHLFISFAPTAPCR